MDPLKKFQLLETNNETVDYCYALYESLPSLRAKHEEFMSVMIDNIPSDMIKGVYFLVRDKCVVYVGKTSSGLWERIDGNWPEPHVTNKAFDQVRFLNLIEVDSYKLDEIETFYIWLFAPFYNSAKRGKDLSHLLPEKYQKQKEMIERQMLEAITIRNLKLTGGLE